MEKRKTNKSSDDEDRFNTIKKKETPPKPPTQSDSDSSDSDQRCKKIKIINKKDEVMSESSSEEDKNNKRKPKKSVSPDSDDSNSKSSGKGKKPSIDESDSNSDRARKKGSKNLKPRIESSSSSEDSNAKIKSKPLKHNSTDSEKVSSDDQKEQKSKRKKYKKANSDSDDDIKQRKKKPKESSDESESEEDKPKINSSKKPQLKHSSTSNSDDIKEIPKNKKSVQKKIKADTDSDSDKPKNNASDSSDSDDQGKTLIRRIKPKPAPQNQSSEDEKAVTRKNGLKLIHIQTKKEYKIEQNVQVKRKKTKRADEIQFDDKNFLINNQEISRNQCEFKPFQKGFVIADKDSSNGTYIMLKKDYQTLVYPGMILEVGAFFLRISKVSVKAIHWQLYQDEENKEEMGKKVSNFKRKNKIKFGKSQGEKNDIQIDDSDILDEQGYFEKNADAIYVIVSSEKKPVWLKLKERNYLLMKNMVIKVSEKHQFSVANVNYVQLNKCVDCEGIADLVFYPCFHNTFCSECRENKFKKCPECKKEINSTEICYEFLLANQK